MNGTARRELFRIVNVNGTVERDTLGKPRVDRKAGVIYGLSVITKMVLTDRPGEIDDVSLSQVVQLGNNTTLGLKSRLGHPNMSGDAMGTMLGRVRNFRLDGDIVRGDLHFDPTAYDTPNGNLADYVMKLAESDPDAFGTSLVFRFEEEYREDGKGQRLKDEHNNELPPLYRFTELFASDVVDDPAANDGLFSGTNVQLSAEATEVLLDVLSRPDAVERVIGFLQRFAANRESAARKPAQEGTMDLTGLTAEHVKLSAPAVYAAIHGAGKTEGITEGQATERTRVGAILSDAAGLEVPVSAAVEPISKGMSAAEAHGVLADKRLASIKASGSKPAGSADAGREGDGQPESFEAACDMIQKRDKCTKAQAISRAAQEFEKLHEAFIEKQPTRRIK